MAASSKSPVHLEIAHVLFIDAVGYSKLLVNEQRELVERLTQVVRNTPQFRKSKAAGKLIRIPAGDGMALVFFQTPEEPVQCAMEIARVLKTDSDIRLRMGVHSGPVEQVKDVNDQANVAGVGINIAQRVMNLGDAGHILVTKRVATDLLEDDHWHSYLHEIGEVELKHGVKMGIVNVYNEELGNPDLPSKLKALKQRQGVFIAARPPTGVFRNRWSVSALAVLVMVAAGIAFYKSANLKSAEHIPEKSIAVLPFENLSDDQQSSFFTDGVQDEILTNLAKIADLKVISRTSTMQYRTGAKRNLRDIGKELGVAHVLEGSVQRAGNRVRVSAQLIDARTDMHLWADRFDRDLADVFAIQTEIAQAVVDELRVQISPVEKAAIEKAPTADLAAHDLYLQAQVLWGDVSYPNRGREKLSESARLLEEAVARDPHFLLAWCLLSKTHGAIYTHDDHTPARLDQANAAVQAALRLQPEAGEGHLALASYHYYGFRDYGRARNELAIAQRTLPNNVEVLQYTGLINRREGNWAEAARNLERALNLDPRNLFLLQQIAFTYVSQRRYADEARVWDRVLTISPGDPSTRIARARVALREKADLKPYQNTIAKLIAENPSVAPDFDDPFFALCERNAAATARALANYPREGVSTDGVNFPPAYWQGVAAYCQGDSVRARAAFTIARNDVAKIVEQQPDFPAAVSLLGMIDAGLGRKDEALREGRRACELLPISKDAVDGAAFAVNLAQIYAWTGEKKLAIEQLGAVTRVPSELSYGLLKLHPYWDPLRGDPEFEKIVAELAPRS